jgi:hypothetical protein
MMRQTEPFKYREINDTVQDRSLCAKDSEEIKIYFKKTKKVKRMKTQTSKLGVLEEKKQEFDIE